MWDESLVNNTICCMHLLNDETVWHEIPDINGALRCELSAEFFRFIWKSVCVRMCRCEECF